MSTVLCDVYLVIVTWLDSSETGSFFYAVAEGSQCMTPQQIIDLEERFGPHGLIVISWQKSSSMHIKQEFIGLGISHAQMKTILREE